MEYKRHLVVLVSNEDLQILEKRRIEMLTVDRPFYSRQAYYGRILKREASRLKRIKGAQPN